jgi:hypothetical protein
MHILKISLLALMIVAGIVAPAAAVTRTVCESGGETFAKSDQISGGCSSLCADFSNTNRSSFIAMSLADWTKGWAKPVPPAVVLPPVPTTITSCKAETDANGYCTMTICGPANVVLERPLRASKPDQSPCSGPNDPCGRKPKTVISPGLLEGDTGFANQGPAAAGTATTSRAPTGIPGRR